MYVAYGAAVQGDILSRDESLTGIVLVDACPLTLGIEITSGVMTKLILRNRVLPTRKSQMYVAYGAAVQGGILSGEESLTGIVLVDACPLTLGIETTSGVMTKLILRNTVLPARKSQMYVAYGSAVQGGASSGDESLPGIVLVDACPLTLGIEITSGVMTKLILRNTVLPTRKSQMYVAYGAAVQGDILSREESLTGIVLVDAGPLTLGIETTSGVMTKLILRNRVLLTRTCRVLESGMPQ
ncbi:unnamed protein product [Peniophora sp. CBMAI 1063]|nr:unnamed protein product [Peniophora sp. CBMAI 1063]